MQRRWLQRTSYHVFPCSIHICKPRVVVGIRKERNNGDKPMLVSTLCLPTNGMGQELLASCEHMSQHLGFTVVPQGVGSIRIKRRKK